jgi:phosphoglycerate dehydrogenase-like enzyme
MNFLPPASNFPARGCYTGRMRVHFENSLDDDDLAVLRRRLPEPIELSGGSMDSGDLADAAIDYLVAGRPSADLLDGHPEIKALIIPWVGPPKATVELIRRRPAIKLYNIHHNAVPVAELALGLLLAAARHMSFRDRLLRKGNWDGSYLLPTMLLKGKSVLLLGYGAIAKELHPVLQALGMKVRAVRRGDAHMDFVFPVRDLDRLLPECDVLISTLPLTEETEALMDAGRLSLMKNSAIVVNVGRGRVFDEDALYEALKNGGIQAAGLDVWYRYPRGEGRSGDTMPAERPFWELDNVVLSPHIGGEWPNPEVQRMRMEHIGELLEALIDGRGPAPLDPETGY